MDKDLPIIISHVKGVRIILERDHLAFILRILNNGNAVTENDDYQPGRNKLQDCSAGSFRPIKKTTQHGIGASSSQPSEDDDEAESSYDEEDEIDTQNTIPMDAFQIEMQTAFEQLWINQEIQEMQLNKIVKSTCHYADELEHQRASIDRQEFLKISCIRFFGY
ncbi:hypothetical protein M9H77_07579 [Catharanthus roseus]|uniref:Uncharacterized protein n=1 Tax=Catharanthus roseus TaxID=4058 RepID=A0ACC0BVI5_CATRO|nr:hypothetical protein M9H77_07579 [Catharanthus roseus]